MPEPRYRRRKEERPQQIAAAAFDVFAEKGYAAARVQEVAKRAGVSKGLMYLYFRTKEELFKAVIKSVVVRRIDALIEVIDRTELPAGRFIRGPMAEFMKQIPGSRVAVVIRLLIAEAPRHPDLVDYYWKNVVSKGLAAIGGLLERGVAEGEFRRSAVNELPQLLIAPVMLSVVWKLLFAKHPLDTDRLIDTHCELLLEFMATGRVRSA